MLRGFADGELTLEERAARSGNRRLRGRFPYNSRAVLSAGGRTGRPRKEEFASRAFAYNVKEQGVDIRLLFGHNWGYPLASRKTRTLDVEDGDDAVTFSATITPEVQETSWARDALAALASGLTIGLSPGFSIPPKRAVEQAERISQEPDLGPGSDQRGAVIRTILSALLWEMSMVTAAAYDEAEVEAEERNWQPTETGLLTRRHALSRWRI